MTEKQRREFAQMDPEKHRQIARSAGRKAHQQGSTDEFTSSEAAAAGRLGGQQVRKDREHMREIGKRGRRWHPILAKFSGPAAQVFESLCAGSLLLCQSDSAFILGPIAHGATLESALQHARLGVHRLRAGVYEAGKGGIRKAKQKKGGACSTVLQ